MASKKKPAAAAVVNPKYILSVVDIGEVLDIVQSMERGQRDVFIGAARLARFAEHRGIIGGATAMNLPTFVEAVVAVLPHVINANRAQFQAMPEALETAKSIILSFRGASKA